MIDTASNTVTATILVGDGPFGVAVTPGREKRLRDQHRIQDGVGDRPLSTPQRSLKRLDVWRRLPDDGANGHDDLSHGKVCGLSIFISYSNHDEAAVRELAGDLERARRDVWLDQELHGGVAWWETILQQIREAELFVLALSNNSQKSKPCRAEVEYARALGIPILPVQIGPLDGMRSAAIADLQIVDYRQRNADAGIRLIAAVQDAGARRRPLPEPLPEPPPIPFEYLLRLGNAIDAPHIGATEQVGVLAQLGHRLKDEDDPGARRDIRRLLQSMRDRSDVTYASVQQIDALLATIDRPQPAKSAAPKETPSAGPPRDPRSMPAQAPYRPVQQAPQYGYQSPSPSWPGPQQWDSQSNRTAARTGASIWSIVGMSLGGLALLLLPIQSAISLFGFICGLAGVAFGVVALVRKERLGLAGLLVAIGALVLGIILAVAIANS